MAILIQAGAGLGLIVLIVFLVLGRKSWKFFHSFMLFWVFVVAVVFAFYAAMVVKARVAWVKAVSHRVEVSSAGGIQQQIVDAKNKGAGLEQIAELLALREQELLYGDDSAVDRPRAWEPLQRNSLQAAKRELQRRLQERGRVTRGCQVTSSGPIQLSIPDAGTGEPPSSLGIDKGIVMFKEVSVFNDAGDSIVDADGNDLMGPGKFVGMFVVTGVDATSVTLREAVPMDSEQQAELTSGGTFVLYERMPRDGHTIFADYDDAENKYVNWDDAQLRAAIPMPPGLASTDPYDAMIKSYLFDQLSIEDAKAADPTFDPPNERRAVKLKFTEDYISEPVNAPEGERDTFSLESGAFNEKGEAMLPGLMQVGADGAIKDQTEFKAGQEAIFDKATADNLIINGKAELADEGELFNRKLVDYEYTFLAGNRFKGIIANKIVRVQKEIDDVTFTLGKIKEEIKFREDEIVLLKDDLSNHQLEAQQIVSHRKRLKDPFDKEELAPNATFTGEWPTMQNEIRQLYREVQYYRDRLATMQARFQEMVNQNVGQTAGVGSD